MSTTVYESAIIDAPLDRVWSVLHTLDFSFLNNVKSCQLEDKAAPNTVGGVRTVSYKDGCVQKVKLVELSEAQNYLTYDIMSSVPPLPVMAHTNTIRCRRVSETNQTYIEFTTDFSRDAKRDVLEDNRFKKRDFFRALAGITESRANQFLKRLDFSNFKKLTAQQVDDAWNLFDTNKDGSLDPRELANVVEGILTKAAEEQQVVSNALVDMFAEPDEEPAKHPAGAAAPAGAFEEKAGGRPAAPVLEKKEEKKAERKSAPTAAQRERGVALSKRVLADIKKQIKPLTKELVGRLDINKDGKIDKAEFALLFPIWFEKKVADVLRVTYF